MDKMTWDAAGKWCPDYKTHDYIWGDTPEDMIANAKEHMETAHPYEWSKMTSGDVKSMEASIGEHFDN